ncbi:hypothetical protein TYRP_006440 [Tyrophagus putrescentiae]|nr:hypothetical protein TYRP_006440 [Tyrophagus putrescentiae]
MANVKTFILLATAAVLTSAHSRGGGGGTSAPKVLQKRRSLSAAERAFDANTDLLAVNWTTFGRSSNFNRLLQGGDNFWSPYSGALQKGKGNAASNSALKSSGSAAADAAEASSQSSSSSSKSSRNFHQFQWHQNGETSKISNSSKNGSGSGSGKESGSSNNEKSNNKSDDKKSSSSTLGSMNGFNNNRFQSEENLKNLNSLEVDEVKRQIAEQLLSLNSLLSALKTKQSLSCYNHRASAEIALQQLQLATLNLVTSCYEPTLKKERKVITTTTPKPTTTTTTHRPEKLLERKTQLKVDPNVMDVLKSGILDGVVVDKN